MKLTLVALALFTAPLAAAPVPFEPADLYRLSMVTDPKVAPDGDRILFTRASFDIQTDTRLGEIWLATLGGKALDKRLLIGAAAKASRVEWSPDGRRLAYVAPWLGKPQLWVMALADGVGRVVTTGKTAPGGFAWSPDGTRLAFVARVEAAPRKIAGMPDKPEGATWAPAPKLISDFNYRSDATGYATAGADQLFVVSVDSGPATQLTKGDFDQVGDAAVSWTRDGANILFSAMLDADRNLRARESDLFSVPASGGAVTQLTKTVGSEADPKVSPDGKSLAFLGALSVPTFYAQDDLWVMPLAGGAARNLTRVLDRPIIAYNWSGEGRGLHALYNDAGVTRVAFVPLNGGKPRVVVPEVGGTRLYLPSSGGSFSEARGTFAFPSLFADRPAGLGVMRGGKAVAGIDLNAGWRAGKSIGKLENIRYKSADGLDIEGWVQFPADFDPAKKYPLALEIHGGPNTDYGPMFSITHQLYAAAGYVVLFTNPRGSIGYGEKFANAIDPKFGGEYPGKDHDDLMAGVDYMVRQPYIDARNLFIGGGSGGGVLTTNAIGRTTRFRAASALRPVTDWTVQALTSDIQATTVKHWVPGNPWDNHAEYWRRSTLSLVGKVVTPTLLIDGEADYRTPIAQTEAYYGALKLRGIDTMMVRLPEAGHTMGRPSQWLQSILTVVEWYDKYRVR